MRSRSTREREAGGGGEGEVLPAKLSPTILNRRHFSAVTVVVAMLGLKMLGLSLRFIWTLYPQDDTEVKVFEDENTGENEKIVEISTGPRGS